MGTLDIPEDILSTPLAFFDDMTLEEVCSESAQEEVSEHFAIRSEKIEGSLLKEAKKKLRPENGRDLFKVYLEIARRLEIDLDVGISLDEVTPEQCFLWQC